MLLAKIAMSFRGLKLSSWCASKFTRLRQVLPARVAAHAPQSVPKCRPQDSSDRGPAPASIRTESLIPRGPRIIRPIVGSEKSVNWPPSWPRAAEESAHGAGPEELTEATHMDAVKKTVRRLAARACSDRHSMPSGASTVAEAACPARRPMGRVPDRPWREARRQGYADPPPARLPRSAAPEQAAPRARRGRLPRPRSSTRTGSALPIHRPGSRPQDLGRDLRRGRPRMQLGQPDDQSRLGRPVIDGDPGERADRAAPSTAGYPDTFWRRRPLPRRGWTPRASTSGSPRTASPERSTSSRSIWTAWISGSEGDHPRQTASRGGGIRLHPGRGAVADPVRPDSSESPMTPGEARLL